MADIQLPASFNKTLTKDHKKQIAARIEKVKDQRINHPVKIVIYLEGLGFLHIQAHLEKDTVKYLDFKPETNEQKATPAKPRAKSTPELLIEATDQAIKAGKITKNGSYYTAGGQKFRGRKALDKAVSANPKLLQG